MGGDTVYDEYPIGTLVKIDMDFSTRVVFHLSLRDCSGLWVVTKERWYNDGCLWQEAYSLREQRYSRFHLGEMKPVDGSVDQHGR